LHWIVSKTGRTFIPIVTALVDLVSNEVIDSKIWEMQYTNPFDLGPFDGSQPLRANHLKTKSAVTQSIIRQCFCVRMSRGASWLAHPKLMRLSRVRIMRRAPVS
jgi:NADPH-dependent 7-cyano-7-deazaguanine reductase QueF-like protein